jgi:hypothetical protein
MRKVFTISRCDEVCTDHEFGQYIGLLRELGINVADDRLAHWSPLLPHPVACQDAGLELVPLLVHGAELTAWCFESPSA